MAASVDAALAEYRTAFHDSRWQLYLDTHHERYRRLIALVLDLRSESAVNGAQAFRILDIGPRFEVDLLHRVIPEAIVDTLGLNPGLFPLQDGERYTEFDLNDAWDPARRPSPTPYQLIVMAEVLEHLHTAPSEVLPWLGSLLVPGGHLVVQTPNAVALPKRLRMLIGIHPFQPLSTDRAYPGHYREYTVSELVREGRSAGLAVAGLETANYFDSEKRSNRAYQRLQRIVPGTLRAGITIVYRAPESIG